MAFKQNLPAFAILGAAGAVVGFIVLTQPPDEDLLRQAATDHVKSVENARDFKIFGETVDVARADGSRIHLAFAKRGGRWAFDRDLGKDFDDRMKEPSFSRDILDRLGRRLTQRFSVTPDFPGLRYAYQVGRDDKGVAAEVAVSFAYPKSQDKQMLGRYVERFRWTAGRWESQGLGSLFDSAAPR